MQILRFLASCGVLIFLSAGCPGHLAAQSQTTPVNIPIAYLTQHTKTLPPLSLADQPTENNGLMGARLGIEDNNTTGKFTGQNFALSEAVVAEDGDIAAAFRDLYGKGNRFFVIDLTETQLLAIADLPEAKDALLFNIHAKDDDLRNDKCRANVLHTIPSYAMLADGLAQYLIWKRWANWLLVTGTGEDDKLFADALRHAAEKFSATIVEERVFDAEPGARRTDTGHAQIQKQMPVFTQDAPDYDVLVVSDVRDAFGEYLQYRTWDPRPVVGTQGLVADGLASQSGAMGRHPDAKSLCAVCWPLDDRARLRRLGRRAQSSPRRRPGRTRGRSCRRYRPISAVRSSALPASRGRSSPSAIGTASSASRSCWRQPAYARFRLAAGRIPA